MRVLFIQALSVEGTSGEKVYPIGIALLAASLLERGYNIDLLDMNIETDPFDAVKNRLLEFRPDVVGLSLRNIDPLANKTSSLVPPFLVTVKLVAAIMPRPGLLPAARRFLCFPSDSCVKRLRFIMAS